MALPSASKHQDISMLSTTTTASYSRFRMFARASHKTNVEVATFWLTCADKPPGSGPAPPSPVAGKWVYFSIALTFTTSFALLGEGGSEGGERDFIPIVSNTHRPHNQTGLLPKTAST